MKKYIPYVCISLLLFILFLGFEFSSHNEIEVEKNKAENYEVSTNTFSDSEIIKEIGKENISESINADTYFELKEQDVIKLVSEVDTLGEQIEVIKNQGNVSFVRGTYGNSQSFYRLYLIDNEGVNIYFEVTNGKDDFDEITQLMEEANYEAIFNLPPNQESFILKTPYEAGNEWGYGKITSVNDKGITVQYENGNIFIFNKGKGITEIHYYIPEEMKDYFTQEQFKAFKVEG